jgi:hypothetical protein
MREPFTVSELLPRTFLKIVWEHVAIFARAEVNAPSSAVAFILRHAAKARSFQDEVYLESSW